MVEFEEKPKLSEALDLVIPERYLIQEADGPGETNAWGVTTDRRTINPQTVRVIVGNDQVPTDSRCFVHYGAIEVAKWYNDNQAIIKSSMAFFMLDPIRPFDGNYLGEEIIIEGEKTESGIYLTPTPETKLPCNIRITHVPENSVFEVGNEVITIDAAQYTLKYEDKTFVRLKENEIIAKVVNGETIPLDKYILVEYVEEENRQLTDENDYKAHLKDVSLKFRLFVPEVDFTPTEPSKNVDAKILSFGPNINAERVGADIGDMVYINRNRGLKLNDGRWIINFDTILFVYEKN